MSTKTEIIRAVLDEYLPKELVSEIESYFQDSSFALTDALRACRSNDIKTIQILTKTGLLKCVDDHLPKVAFKYGNPELCDHFDMKSVLIYYSDFQYISEKNVKYTIGKMDRTQLIDMIGETYTSENMRIAALNRLYQLDSKALTPAMLYRIARGGLETLFLHFVELAEPNLIKSLRIKDVDDFGNIFTRAIYYEYCDKTLVLCRYKECTNVAIDSGIYCQEHDPWFKALDYDNNWSVYPGTNIKYNNTCNVVKINNNQYAYLKDGVITRNHPTLSKLAKSRQVYDGDLECEEIGSLNVALAAEIKGFVLRESDKDQIYCIGKLDSNNKLIALDANDLIKIKLFDLRYKPNNK